MPVTPILQLTCPLQKHRQEMSEHTWELPQARQGQDQAPHSTAALGTSVRKAGPREGPQSPPSSLENTH